RAPRRIRAASGSLSSSARWRGSVASPVRSSGPGTDILAPTAPAVCRLLSPPPCRQPCARSAAGGAAVRREIASRIGPPMHWKTVGIIFRKEFLDILRDRKTLIFMIALPTLVMPGLMSVITRIAIHGQQQARRAPLIVQCEQDERDRFLALLTRRAHPPAAPRDHGLPPFRPR